MRYSLTLFTLLLSVLPFELQADCLSGIDVAQRTDVTLFEQISFINKKPSIWLIEDETPYTKNNFYNDMGIHIISGCSLIDNVLELDFSLYGLTYATLHPVGKFESDSSRSRILIDQLRLVYTLSDQVQVEIGKLNAKRGLFFLRSPSDLSSHYYEGFKPTRIYDPILWAAYEAASWSSRLFVDTREHSLSLTIVPKLAYINERYTASGSWSVEQRGNSSEEYLLSYTDYRVSDHTPGLWIRLGESRSVAISDSYAYTPQLLINADMAYHTQQQWRHLSMQSVAEAFNYNFPLALYNTHDKASVELALAGQYTSDRFDVFGLEYYFQSEGYSRVEWRQQRDFIYWLNETAGFEMLERAFDAYKYLMAAEIGNTMNKGMLQRKHYLNAYSSIQTANQGKFQPYLTVSLMDLSLILGLHYSRLLPYMDEKLEAFTGLYLTQGHADSEFGLFGDTLGLYYGIKYYL
ncbi:hypothetical protein ABDZ32_11515 [Aeromonas veronii]|uniref:hypothetical protein n=1 Tax=Aeromonas veronii TaxID=654 RepID=UPI0031FD7D6B